MVVSTFLTGVQTASIYGLLNPKLVHEDSCRPLSELPHTSTKTGKWGDPEDNVFLQSESKIVITSHCLSFSFVGSVLIFVLIMDFLMILKWLLYPCRPHTKLEKKAFPMSNYWTKNLGIHYDWSTWSCVYIWTSDWDMGDGVTLHGLAIQNVLQDLSKVSSTQKSSCYSVEGRTRGYWVGNQ